MNKMLYVLVPAALMATEGRAMDQDGLAAIVAAIPLVTEGPPAEPKEEPRGPIENVAILPGQLRARKEDAENPADWAPGSEGINGLGNGYRG